MSGPAPTPDPGESPAAARPAPRPGAEPTGHPTRWSAPLREIPPGGSAKFPLAWRGQRVEAFVVNFEGRLHADLNRCAHAGTPLDWWPNEFFSDDGRLLVCATHGALYKPETGRCAGGPCGGGALYRLAVRIEGDRIVVSAGDDTDGVAADDAARGAPDPPDPVGP